MIANLRMDTKSAVQEKVSDFFTQLSGRRDEAQRRCRTVLQSRAGDILYTTQTYPYRPTDVDLTFVLV